jgi:threonine/homoserine/homoserine lactone efflux protein
MESTTFALALFAFVGSITPGPNNMLVLASGLNFGFKKTLPHLFGITLGFALMAVAVAAGMVQVFNWSPHVRNVMTALGVAYMVWMAWSLATAVPSAPVDAGEVSNSSISPMTMMGAMAFQWINPKAWWLAAGVTSTYLPPNPTWNSLLMVAVVFSCVNLPCIALWAFGGTQMRALLKSPKQLAIFNRVMAALLIVSLYPIVFR